MSEPTERSIWDTIADEAQLRLDGPVPSSDELLDDLIEQCGVERSQLGQPRFSQRPEIQTSFSQGTQSIYRMKRCVEEQLDALELASTLDRLMQEGER